MDGSPRVQLPGLSQELGSAGPKCKELQETTKSCWWIIQPACFSVCQLFGATRCAKSLNAKTVSLDMLPFRGGAGRISGEANIEKEAIVIAAEGSKITWRGIPHPTGTCYSSSKRRQFQNEDLLNCERMFCLKLYMVQDIQSFLILPPSQKACLRFV